MTTKKPTPTRTFNPIHFEDLDPHRFEDLVREIAYDFRDWQVIEATGRGGDDAGIDIRGYERTAGDVIESDDSVEEGDRHPMEGNQWVIQVKREREVGPSKVRKIVGGVDHVSPPYGYILAAPVNFSKKSYDAFREVLRAKGVMEFYLWGKAELEDMLHQPKNDRLLFTYLGVSLSSRRRTRATQIRSVVSTKNKLFKLLGAPNQRFYKEVLLRDAADTNYPHKSSIPGFDQRPAWISGFAFTHGVSGFWVRRAEHSAYADFEKKEFDFYDGVDLLARRVRNDDDRAEEDVSEARTQDELVRGVWDFFPRARQATYGISGLVPYDRIVVIDPDGDVRNHMPHLYVEFSKDEGPFVRFLETLNAGENEVFVQNGWKRIKRFPNPLTPAPEGRIHRNRKILLDKESVRLIRDYQRGADTLFADDDRYNFLRPRDVIAIDGGGAGDTWIEITSVSDEIAPEAFTLIWHRANTLRQLGREPAAGAKLRVIEFRTTWKGQTADQGMIVE